MDKNALYLFNIGENAEAYRALGAHLSKEGEVEGWRFTVYAPNAKKISVVGDFNDWNEAALPMKKDAETGCWEAFAPNIWCGQKYKYRITGADGKVCYKADPFAFRAEMRPGTASVIHGLPSFDWTDGAYLEKRQSESQFNRAINIYEAHLGSWRKDRTLAELTDELIDYCAEMGYTHIELLPVSEFPLDDSWGYQTLGYYAVSARYGTPEQLMAFIDRAHSKNIGVILDWVPAHFVKDESGLIRFDGSPLFESRDPLRAEMPQWGTLLFDYARAEVRSFLISNAVFWLKLFHADGLRVDAVSCMLYHDFGREKWRKNIHGGNTNLEAVEFLKQLNIVAHRECPSCLIIAEESTAFAHITRPVHEGGLGFDYKWNMGFMNDTLYYFEKDPVYRKYHHDKLTFPMSYAYAEQYVLPFSHDEVVHGKHSLIGRMQGSYEQQFEQLRLLFAYQFAHPGKKLNFMGSEFGQFIEWDFKRELDWFLLDYPAHRDMHDFSRALNKFYLENPCLHREDTGFFGFRWLSVDDNENSVIAFARRDGKSRLVFIANFTPVTHKAYRMPLDEIIGAPVKLSCVFSTHGRELTLKSKKVRKGERYAELPLYPYEAAFYKY